MSATDEKPYAEHGVGDSEAHGVKHEVARVDDFDFTPQEQKRIIQRIDRRLVVTVGAMYCVSLMDRTNLGAANIAGMGKDLGLSVGTRYVSVLVANQFAWLKALDLHEAFFLTCETVSHNSCLLCYLHRLPTSIDRYRPEAWA